MARSATRGMVGRMRCFALVLLLCGYLPAAHAYDPLEFVPEHVPDARLNGSSVVRRYGKPVYIVKLFVDQGDYAKQSFSKQDLSHEPLALDVEFLQASSGADIARELRSQMRDMGLVPKREIDDWTASLRRFLPDLKKHDHLTAVYQPAQGTHFYRNGDALSDIGGNDFAQAFFGIWLDDASTVPGARARLLHDPQ